MSARVIELPCRVDIARTEDDLHAHFTLEGATPGPGDRVRLLAASAIEAAEGERRVATGRALLHRAGPFARSLARLRSLLELDELYDVSF